MSITGEWVKAEYFPQDETGLVGGAADAAAPLAGLLGEIFEVGRSKFLGRGTYDRFRKVFFLNQGSEITDPVAFFADLEHIDQLKFAFEKTPGDTSTNSATMPDGYVTGDFVAPIGLLDAVDVPTSPIPALTGEVGFWLWQQIQEGLSPETGALATIRVAGVIL